MIDPTTNHVQFDATLDDLIDVQMRFLRRSDVASSWPRADSLLVAAGTALLLFLVVQVLFHAALAPSLVGAGVAAAFAYVVYPYDYHRRVRRRLGRLLAEQLGETRALRCEVKLRSQGIWVRQGGTELLHDWSTVRAVEDTPAGIEFRFAGGMLLVRNRAFSTQPAREHFLAQSRILARAAGA